MPLLKKILWAVFRDKTDEQKRRNLCSTSSIVKEYNAFIGGVDVLDAYVAYYKTHIKSKKYYLQLFFTL